MADLTAWFFGVISPTGRDKYRREFEIVRGCELRTDEVPNRLAPKMQ